MFVYYLHFSIVILIGVLRSILLILHHAELAVFLEHLAEDVLVRVLHLLMLPFEVCCA